MDRELSTVEVAQSLWNLAGKINALAAPPDWKAPEWTAIGFDKQSPWLQLAARGPNRMESFEGAPLREVAFHIFLLTNTPEEAQNAQDVWNAAPLAFKVMWEALTRHMHMLTDCDELDSPEGSENMWVEWFQKKLSQQRIIIPEGVTT